MQPGRAAPGQAQRTAASRGFTAGNKGELVPERVRCGNLMDRPVLHAACWLTCRMGCCCRRSWITMKVEEASVVAKFLEEPFVVCYCLQGAVSRTG